MRRLLVLVPFIAVFALAGCARFGPYQSGPSDASGNASPAAATAQAASAIDVGTFLDPAAAKQLSAKDQAEAASAQFYALQFGRPGAPRQWQGETGATGSITVGPYVRVNDLDCRDFTHTVTVGGNEYVRKGTACREQNGQWSVVDASAG